MEGYWEGMECGVVHRLLLLLLEPCFNVFHLIYCGIPGS